MYFLSSCEIYRRIIITHIFVDFIIDYPWDLSMLWLQSLLIRRTTQKQLLNYHYKKNRAFESISKLNCIVFCHRSIAKNKFLFFFFSINLKLEEKNIKL